ncbi:MAG: hypothetical protein QNJ63_23000 [Calothrix sp. MO_192.B10]|nr:hypothetical protein [Calothrix sp. MO_192.B10]
MGNAQDTKDQFVVEKSDLSFKTWLAKPYISDELRQQLLKSNVLLLPQENFREGTGIIFPIGTDEIFSDLRENAPDDVCIDILIEDSDYKEIALFSDPLIILGGFIVTSIVAPIFVNLLSDYLIKKRLIQKTASQIRIEILVEGNKETTRVFYEGSVSDFYKTVYPVVESISLQSKELKELPSNGNE